MCFIAVSLGRLSAGYAQATSTLAVQDVTPPPSSLQPGPYFALVIGNNNYQHLNKLETAVNDANAVARMLRERYGFQTKILLDATRNQILTALVEYRQTLPEDSNLLIYYAGHGHHDRDTDEAYWLPVDAQANNNQNWISADDITRDVRAMRSVHVLVISDSCYSGYLVRDAGAAIDPKDWGVYLAKMLKSKSRTLMSSGGDEPVADSGAPGHSVFAEAILESLRRMEDNNFTAAFLFQTFIQPRVGGRSDQLPQYSWIRNSGHDAGDFVFSRQSVAKNSTSGDETAEAASTGVEAEVREGASPTGNAPKASVAGSAATENWAAVPSRRISGWIAGLEVMLHTEDGGRSWQEQSVGSFLANSVTFITPQTGWAVGRNGDILHTTDSGHTWEKQRRGDGGELVSVTFVTPQEGWATGTDAHFNGIILHTNDGGRTWLHNYRQRGILLSIAFVTRQAGWAVGEGGAILHTLDGGATWHLQNEHSVIDPQLTSVAFVTPQSGWAVGNEGWHGTILHTEDGGGTWKEQPSGTQRTLFSVDFVTPRLGWAAGDAGTILHTEDGGRKWEEQRSGTKATLHCIRFVAPQVGWVVGTDSVVLHTEDGGRTWLPVNGGHFGGWLNSIVFVNQQ